METPTKEQAQQFALMLSSGMPSRDAIRYFLPEGEVTEGMIARQHDVWMRSKEVSAAVQALQGRPWQEMRVEERIKLAIEKHYSEMAYFLYSHNYAELVGAEKQKADTCRNALEVKLAGLAGKLDPLSRFYDDLISGKIKGMQVGTV